MWQCAPNSDSNSGAVSPCLEEAADAIRDVRTRGGRDAHRVS